MIALHFVVQRQKVEGVKACAPHLEVRKYRLRRDVGIQGLGVPDLPDPCVVDNDEYELCRLPPCCLVSRMVGALLFMCSFCARAYDGCSVVVNGGILGSDPRGFGECRVVARDICSLHPKEADEVMHRARFVIWDLEKEERDDLPDSCEVGVGRFPGNRLEFLERMGEFCHNLLGRHCDQRRRARRLWGQVPPSLGSY